MNFSHKSNYRTFPLEPDVFILHTGECKGKSGVVPYTALGKTFFKSIAVRFFLNTPG